ncbi:nicotinamide mononucleotide transporter [Dyadobacter arcticus]|uniref:Nicotinamide riboside transporter PnuC n=1 Tax=Dyadobacter arcticus TaxID=1078754 RepID=A0ABX0UGW2_9BACT|nr:nicotinamide mononucleotide transporter [Dyadobacter arcticus]NIJ52247.1 nicotinamide riboside transporter PnuC [Dyadobacter arcticus]
MTTDLFRYYCLDWLWFGTSILAVYLLGNKNKLGFVSMIVSDLTGLAMAYLTQSTATLIGSLIYLALNVRGWYAWRADEKRIATQRIANLRP